MNKGELISEVAKVVSTKKEAKAAVDCVFSTITKTLNEGDRVSFDKERGKKGPSAVNVTVIQ